MHESDFNWTGTGEDIIIEGDQKKRLLSIFQFQVSSLNSLFLFLPLFCNLIWKEERAYLFLHKRWAYFSYGFMTAELTQDITTAKFIRRSVSVANCSWSYCLRMNILAVLENLIQFSSLFGLLLFISFFSHAAYG